MKKYEHIYKVSRGVFSGSYETDLKPWIPPNPIPYEPSTQVYNRLFEDFNRRQEAKKRLETIIQYKENLVKRRLSLDKETKKSSKGFSKLDHNKTVQRLQAYWNNKWLKIQAKQKELKEIQEKEFQEMMTQKVFTKTDPKAFERLTSPRVKYSAQSKTETKKFSIREAIESGKRLMNGKSTKTPSPVRINQYTTKKTQAFENFTKSFSPSKTHRPAGKDIDEIISRCKTKALLIKNQPNNRTNFVISDTFNISLPPELIKK